MAVLSITIRPLAEVKGGEGRGGDMQQLYAPALGLRLESTDTSAWLRVQLQLGNCHQWPD